MKKISSFILCGVVCLFLFACNGDKHAIIKSAYGYLNAMGNYKFDEAAPYATDATKELTLKYITEVIMPVTDTNYIKSNTPANIEIVKVHFKNDSVASVDYTKHTPIKMQEGSLEMRKCGEEWLAHVIINNRIIQPIPSREVMDSIGKTLQAVRDTSNLKVVPSEDLNIERMKQVK